MSNEIKEKKEYEKYARDHRKELDAQEVKLGDVVKVLVGQFAGEKGVIVGMIACDKSDYADPYYEIEMECDVPEEFRVRKTLIGRSRVIGGVEKRYLKVIGNRAPKQPSMEIKQGDKVRVSEKTPIEYNPHGEYAPLCVINSVVRCVVNDYAMCEPIWDDGAIQTPFLIPTKYLVKVDAEAKEAKFKVGDRVEELISRRSGIVLGIEGDIVVVGIPYDKEKQYWHIDSVELVKPTEQTETEKKPNVGSITIPVKADLTDSYWDAYTADLAKEVALKVANKFNAPHEAADYAVSVAKAVVEGLKRK